MVDIHSEYCAHSPVNQGGELVTTFSVTAHRNSKGGGTAGAGLLSKQHAIGETRTLSAFLSPGALLVDCYLACRRLVNR